MININNRECIYGLLCAFLALKVIDDADRRNINEMLMLRDLEEDGYGRFKR